LTFFSKNRNKKKFLFSKNGQKQKLWIDRNFWFETFNGRSSEEIVDFTMRRFCRHFWRFLLLRRLSTHPSTEWRERSVGSKLNACHGKKSPFKIFTLIYHNNNSSIIDIYFYETFSSQTQTFSACAQLFRHPVWC
jgi:hypothetical protein